MLDIDARDVKAVKATKIKSIDSYINLVPHLVVKQRGLIMDNQNITILDKLNEQ